MPPARDRTDDRDYPAPPAPRSDVYTGLLGLALAAQVAGAIFLWMDYNSYGDKPPPVKAPAAIQPAGAAPAPGGVAPAPAPGKAPGGGDAGKK
jgi:hypothetical protein